MREYENTNGLPEPMWEQCDAPHLLVCLTRINVQADMQLHSLVEFRGRGILDKTDGRVRVIECQVLDCLSGLGVSLAVLLALVDYP